jgi:hypothetical protein
VKPTRTVNAVVGETTRVTLYALDDIGDAIDATRELVLPFEWWTWLRLGVVVALLGGAGGGFGQLSNVFQFGSGSDFESPGLLASTLGDPTTVTAFAQAGQPDVDPEMFLGPAMVLVVALVLLVVLAVVLLGAIGATMEFVLVQTLRRERVSVGADFGANFVNGIRLVIFRYALWLIAFGIIGAVFVAMLGTDPSAWTETAIFNALGPLLVVGLIVLLLAVIINGFTKVFAVPIMLAEDRGILSAWRRLLGTIAGNLGQFLVYLVLSVLLGIAVNIVLGIAVLFALIAVAIPVGIVAGALFIALSGPLMWILAGTVGFVGIVALVVAGMFISVPLFVFLRYYALFVLGDVEESLDPIPEVRDRVRGVEDVKPV